MRGKSKKSYHHGNLRDALVLAAIPVLKAKGVVGLSLRELANELGVSHGAPYRHFPNKTELLKAIAIEGYRNLAEACTSAQKKHPSDPRMQLFEAGLGYLEFVSNNREIADLMFGRGFAGEEHGSMINEAASLGVRELAVIIENGKKDGLYGQRDTEHLVLTALSTVHGLSMLVTGGFLGEFADSDAKVRALGGALFEIVTQGMFSEEQKHRNGGNLPNT